MECQAATANQECHIGSLATAIGMKFVKDKVPQVLGRADQFAVFGTSQQQFQHHVVGEQDIGRVAADRFALFAFLLACVAGIAHGRLVFRIAPFQKLGEFFVLAVGQSIHGIDDNRLDSAARAIAEDMINDGHDVGETFARTGAAGQNVAFVFLCLADGFSLVRVQGQWFAKQVCF